MTAYAPTSRMLWNLTPSNTPIALSGAGSASGAVVDLGDVTDVWLAAFVAGTSTGTSPTLDVQLDVQDADGNWFPQVAKVTQITAGPGSSSASVGLHVTATALVLPRWGRVTWTLGGTTPVFPKTSICLYGR